jgi:hypothetical protein
VNDALKQLEAMLSQTAVATPRFPPNSRYAQTPAKTLVAADGRMVAYLQRRFVPAPERFALLREHAVEQGDRLDTLAAAQLGDPLLFWRLCDANNAIRPEALIETPGTRLRITLPEGVPGAGDG